MEKFSTPSPVSASGETASERLTRKLRAFQRTVAVERLLGVQGKFQPMLKGLCEAAVHGLAVERVMLALVSADTDHYALQQGFAPALAPHSHSQGATLCHHVIDQGLPLVIDDTRAAPPWRDIGSVRHGGVHAYLGVPVRFQGEVVGSLCVVTPEARAWQEREVALLGSLAVLAEQAFQSAWSQELADHCAEQTRQRLQALEAGIIHRQMAFREIRQALALQVAKLKMSPQGTRTSDVDWLERLHEHLGEVNEGVLSGLGSATAEAPLAQTTFAELLALAAHVVAPRRIHLNADGPQDHALLTEPISAAHQPALLRMLVTILQESVRALRPDQSLRVMVHGLDDTGQALAFGVTDAGGQPQELADDLVPHVSAMIRDPMRQLGCRLWASDQSPRHILFSMFGAGPEPQA